MNNAHGVPPAPSLEVRDLRLVQAIADAGSATRAASTLHVSQSAVSHGLKDLERRLGVDLFDRVNGRLRITPSGRRIVQLAGEIIRPLALAERELRDGAAATQRVLRVGTQCYTAFHWLPRVVRQLVRCHPEVRLELSGTPGTEPLEQLVSGKLDLALCVGPISSPRLQVERLFQDELVLITAVDHPLARKRWVTGDELLGETLIVMEVADTQRERVRRSLFGSRPGFARVIRVSIAETVVDLVQAGLGVGIVTGWSAAARVARGDVARVRLTARGLKRQWHGVYGKRSPVADAIRTVLDELRDVSEAG